MKQAKHILLLAALLLSSLATSAHDFEVGGIYYNITSSTTVTVTFRGDSYTSYSDEYSGAVTIPSSVTYNGNTYSVTSIGYSAFYNCSSLTFINIPENLQLTSIEKSAFFGCSSLTAIAIPEGVTSIGAVAFYNCRSLTEITIPEGVTSIGNDAFGGCSNLASITTPESVTSIGERAFDGTAWRNKLPDGLNYIGKVLYKYKGEMPVNTSIEVREGTVSISSSAFYNCSSLTSVTIPNSVTSIGDGAFYKCSGLTSITLPESVVNIGGSAFSFSGLTSITIPESVTNIGGYAFSDCRSLTSITSLANVTSIEEGAFSYCVSLTSITIPASVTNIEESAFSGCRSLATITIPESVTSIGERAFCDCSSLTSITLPEGVTSIGERAFYNCRSLTSITIPESVASIGYYAFYGCSSFTAVYCYAESVPSTDAYSFYGSSIEDVTLHVPASALEAYKTTVPWSSFGIIVELGAAITKITLDKNSATLTEGEELILTIITTPNNADKNLISWSSSNPSVAIVNNAGKVTAIAKGTATITATANDGSGVSASCEIVVNELILGKCATPVIGYTDGKVVFDCDTEEATIKSNIKENVAGEYNDMEVALIPTYTITVYATKAQYEDSDVATLTLCWIACNEGHEEDNGIITIPSQPVLIQCANGILTLTGLTDGTKVKVYDTAGTQQGAATATDGTAIINTQLTAGSVAIVKIEDNSIKVVIK